MKWFRILALMILIITLASCEHKELCLQHDHYRRLRIEFDWRYAPDADPDLMYVWFFPSERGGNAYRALLDGRKGGYVEVTDGMYDLIACEICEDFLQFSNHVESEFSSHHAFTPETGLLKPLTGSDGGSSSLMAEGAADERVISAPERFHACSDTNVGITETTEVITLYPREAGCHYSLTVCNAAGLDRFTGVSASLSGMAKGMFLADNSEHPELCTIPFAMEKIDDTTLRAEFVTFGHHEDNAAPHKVMLYSQSNDGKIYSMGHGLEHFDVTEQVHGAVDPRHVDLIIDGADLSGQLPTPSGGGIGSSTEEWEEENHEVEYNY